jgi:hypothetical protein
MKTYVTSSCLASIDDNFDDDVAIDVLIPHSFEQNHVNVTRDDYGHQPPQRLPRNVFVVRIRGPS